KAVRKHDGNNKSKQMRPNGSFGIKLNLVIRLCYVFFVAFQSPSLSFLEFYADVFFKVLLLRL
ncbi:MAG: hypothetical protein ACTTIF_07365, partial [Prevotella sp.]